MKFLQVVQWVHLLRRADLTFEAIDAELQSLEASVSSPITVKLILIYGVFFLKW